MMDLWLPPKPAIIRPAPIQKASFLPGMFPGGALTGVSTLAENFPVIEATNTGNENSADTTYSAPLPASIASGDLLLVFIATYSTVAITLNIPSGWAKLWTSIADGSFLRSFDCLYRTATGSEGATLATTLTNNAFKASISYRISGWSILDAAIGNRVSGGVTPNSPNLTPSWGSDKTLWLSAFGAFSDPTTQSAGPTNYTGLLQQQNTNSGQDRPRVATAHRFFEAASENPGAFATALNGGASVHAGATVGIRGV